MSSVAPEGEHKYPITLSMCELDNLRNLTRSRIMMLQEKKRLSAASARYLAELVALLERLDELFFPLIPCA